MQYMIITYLCACSFNFASQAQAQGHKAAKHRAAQGIGTAAGSPPTVLPDAAAVCVELLGEPHSCQLAIGGRPPEPVPTSSE